MITISHSSFLIRKEFFDILTHKTVSKDFKLYRLRETLNFTAESMSETNSSPQARYTGSGFCVSKVHCKCLPEAKYSIMAKES